MLYIPKYYFSFFGMLAYSVNAHLHAYANAIATFNAFTNIKKLYTLIITIKPIIQSKTK